MQYSHDMIDIDFSNFGILKIKVKQIRLVDINMWISLTELVKFI